MEVSIVNAIKNQIEEGDEAWNIKLGHALERGHEHHEARYQQISQIAGLFASNNLLYPL